VDRGIDVYPPCLDMEWRKLVFLARPSTQPPTRVCFPWLRVWSRAELSLLGKAKAKAAAEAGGEAPPKNALFKQFTGC
jgi:hypothetical protein